jgi:hypothetical protein
MDFFLEKEQQRHIKNGAKSAYVMPYPYEKGHFCLYYDDGRREYARLSDDVYEQAVKAWGGLEACQGGCEGDDELRLLTYIRLMNGKEEGSGEPSQREKELIRLLMDAHLPGMRGRAIRLVGECYSDNLRAGRGMRQLEACARKCLHS